MKAGGFAAGMAPVEVRHDRRTEQAIAKFRTRVHEGTDAAVLAAADAVEHLPQQHPLCGELRAIVNAELDARHLSLAPLAGGAK